MFCRPYTVDSRLKNAVLSCSSLSFLERASFELRLLVIDLQNSNEAQVDKDDNFNLVSA